MSYEHIEFRDNNKLFSVYLGQRFEIIFHHLFPHISDTATGIIVGIVDVEETYLAKLLNKGFLARPKMVMVVAMDSPMNQKPTSDERLYAQQYNLPVNQILAIPQASIQKTVGFRWARTRPAREYSPHNAVLMCSHPTCKSFRNTDSLVMLCGDHVLCRSHLLIGAEKGGVFTINESSVADFFANLTRRANELGLPAAFLETKAVIYGSAWKGMLTKDEGAKEQFLRTIVEGDSLLCPVCQVFGHKCQVPVADMEKQLFCTSVGGGVDNRKMILQDFREKVRRFGTGGREKSAHERARELEEWQLQEAIRMSMGVAAAPAGDDNTAISLRQASHMSVNNEVVMTDVNNQSEPYLLLPDMIFYVSDSRNTDGVVIGPESNTTVLQLKEQSLTALRRNNRIGPASDSPLPIRPGVGALSALDNKRYRLLVLDSVTKEGANCSAAARQLPFRRELSHTSWKQEDDPYAMSICELSPVTYLEVRETFENIGPPMDIHSLPADFRYNKSLIDKTASLGNAFAGFRKIRGDGNCYFRAVMYGLLEQFILQNRRDRFHRLFLIFSACADELENTLAAPPPPPPPPPPQEKVSVAASAAATVTFSHSPSNPLKTIVGNEDNLKPKDMFLDKSIDDFVIVDSSDAVPGNSGAAADKDKNIQSQLDEAAARQREKWLKQKLDQGDGEAVVAAGGGGGGRANEDLSSVGGATEQDSVSGVSPSATAAAVATAIDFAGTAASAAAGDELDSIHESSYVAGENSNIPGRVAACRAVAALMRLAFRGSIWRTVAELEASVLGPQQHQMAEAMGLARDCPSAEEAAMGIMVDSNFILAARSVLASFIMNNKDMQIDDFTLESFLKSSYPEHETLESYCAEYVLTMDVSAEGPYVCLGLLCTALGSKCITVFLDRDPKVPLNFFESAEASLSPTASVLKEAGGVSGIGPKHSVEPLVYLLLRPGHYDLLYPMHLVHTAEHPPYSGADLVELCIPAAAVAAAPASASTAAGGGAASASGSPMPAAKAAPAYPLGVVIPAGQVVAIGSASASAGASSANASTASPAPMTTAAARDVASTPRSRSSSQRQPSGRLFSPSVSNFSGLENGAVSLLTTLATVAAAIQHQQRLTPVNTTEAAALVLPRFSRITLESVWPNVYNSIDGVYLYFPRLSRNHRDVGRVTLARGIRSNEDGGQYMSRSVHKIYALKVPHDELLIYCRTAFGIEEDVAVSFFSPSTPVAGTDYEAAVVAGLGDKAGVIVRVQNIVQLKVDITDIDPAKDYVHHTPHTMPPGDLHLLAGGGEAREVSIYMDVNRFADLNALYRGVARLLGLPLSRSFEQPVVPTKPPKPHEKGAHTALPAGAAPAAVADAALLAALLQKDRNNSSIASAVSVDTSGLAQRSFRLKVVDPKLKVTVKIVNALNAPPRDVFLKLSARSPLRDLKSAIASELKVSNLDTLRVYVTVAGKKQLIANDAAAASLVADSALEAQWCSMDCKNCVGSQDAAALMRVGDSPFITIAGCAHSVCVPCAEAYIHSFDLPDPPPGVEGEAKGPSGWGTSLFQFLPLPEPGEARDFEAQPPTISHKAVCPVTGCQCNVTVEDIGNMDAYNSILGVAIKAYRDDVLALRSYRRCCFADVVCFAELEPFQGMMGLQCGHFMHAECFVSSLNTEIGKPKHENHIVCYQCVQEAEASENPAEYAGCMCPWCYSDGVRRPDRHPSGAHIIAAGEVKYLVDSPDFPNFDESVYEKWDGIYSAVSRRHVSAMGDEVMVTCKQCDGDFFIPKYMSERVETIECLNCRHKMCTLCRKAPHTGYTCEEAAQMEQEEFLRKAGINFLQYCPECKHPWDVPNACLHVRCEAKDCQMEFCFICAAPFTPVRMHDNSYHLRECGLFGACCDNKCILEKLPDGTYVQECKAENSERKFLPGPCDECQKGDANIHNSCSHNVGQWKPCLKCRTARVRCTHWCLECRRIGSACERPINAVVAEKEGKGDFLDGKGAEMYPGLAAKAGAGAIAAAADANADADADGDAALDSDASDTSSHSDGRARAMPIGCDSHCVTKHNVDDECVKCYQRWGVHSGGHNCPRGGLNGGKRGSFISGQLSRQVAKGCLPGCTKVHKTTDSCLHCGKTWTQHNFEHECPADGLNAGKHASFVVGALIGCGKECELKHNMEHVCVKCARFWAEHSDHTCPKSGIRNAGGRGAFPVLLRADKSKKARGRAAHAAAADLGDMEEELVGCPPNCAANHKSDDGCVKCRRRWGEHSGHKCPRGTSNAGNKGSFMSGPVPPPKARPGRMRFKNKVLDLKGVQEEARRLNREPPAEKEN